MKKTVFIVSPIVVLVIILYIISVDRHIEVGVVADISGKNSELGVSARNGVAMAIEELNKMGGVKGREFRLHVKDHRGDKEHCTVVTRELVEEGVQFIIGPTISGLADSVIAGTEGSDVLIIGPTVSADYLKGRDDNFLRLSSPSSIQGKNIASIMKSEGLNRVALVVDDKNRAYAQGVVEGFKEGIEGSGITLIYELYYTETTEFTNFITDIDRSKIDALFLISNGADGGEFVQKFNKVYELPRLFGSGWNKVGQMEKYSGRLIDGMIFVDNYRAEVPGEKETAFIKRYNEIFHMDSNNVVKFYYEALQWFYYGILDSDSFNNQEIKAAIVNREVFHGIYEDYSIDEYGDGVRMSQNFIYRNGRYELYE